MNTGAHGDPLRDPEPDDEVQEQESGEGLADHERFPDQPTDDAAPHGDPLRASNPNAAGPAGLSGGMGVSSERVGPTGPGQESTDGQRLVAEDEGDTTEGPPEQAPGNPEENPTGLAPKEHDPARNPGHSHG